VAEVAHTKHSESKACCAREFQGLFAGDGPGDECGGEDIPDGLERVWDAVERIPTGDESACAGAEEEFVPIKWSVIVHRHFGALDGDVDGRAENCPGYEMCFCVWHTHFRFLKRV